ncbi:MAG: hypothetical protein JXJ22_07670 [Bacteroidales bacterium]|nr:hypothetical protein [Bacteroidales bacterium]
MTKRVLVLLLILFAWKIIHADEPILSFEHLNLEDGLSHSTIQCIYKDSKGFMWFGTPAGLNKFDGYDFVVYLHNPEDSNSISDNNISDIYEDSNNTLWISTLGFGIDAFNREQNTFRHYSFGDPVNPKNMIRKVIEDKSNNFWVATQGGGLIKLKRQDGSFIIYTTEPANKNSIYSNYISDLDIDSKGNLWIATYEGAIARYNPERDDFTNYIYNKRIQGNRTVEYIGRIYIDDIDNIWICTQENGLYIYDINKNTFQHIKTILNQSIEGNIILTDVIQNKEGDYWITSDHGGLYYYDREYKNFYNFRYDHANSKSISNNQIYNIYKDNLNNIWLGNYKGGINYYVDEAHNFKLYTDKGEGKGLSQKSVLSFYIDTKNRIWIGTDGGGINNFDPVKKTFKAYVNKPGDSNSLRSNVITTICEDSKGYIWMGTYLGGINILNTNNGAVSHMFHDPLNSRSINDNSIWSLLKDHKNNIWMGTLTAGLNVFNEKDGSLQSNKHEAGDSTSISHNFVRVIYEDKNKDIWIGTGNGLNKFLTKDSTFVVIKNDINNKNSLSNNVVRCIFEDSRKNLWVGTSDGLNKMNRKDYSCTRYTVTDGLPSSFIQGIQEDGAGFLWISTNKGLSQFNTTDLTFKNYDITDGLQSNEFNLMSSAKDKNGNMYFGGISGFNVFHPDSIKENRNIPPVVLTDFFIFNKPVKIGENSPLKQHINVTQNINLTYRQNSITIEYAALNFIFPDRCQYKYMLSGLDDNWNYVRNKRFATYTNLDPGTYTFSVTATNHDGYWNETGTSIKIIISPPFWKTIWFRIISSLVIIGLLFGIYFYRVSSLTKQKIYLEKIVGERTKEIEEKNIVLKEQADYLNETNAVLEERQQFIEEQAEELKSTAEELKHKNESLNLVNATKDKFFSIIAHDLKNPINTILGFTEVLHSKYEKLADDKRKKYIDAVNGSTLKIYRLLENLLQWARSQTNSVQINPEKFNLYTLVHSNSELVENECMEKDIKLNINVPENADVFADQNMINTVIRNLLTNAIKYTEKGRITVYSRLLNNYHEISITDTGIGISEDVQNTIFKLDNSKSIQGTRGESGTGLGLIICKEFVEKNSGTIRVESKEGEGSTFIFTVPVA